MSRFNCSLLSNAVTFTLWMGSGASDKQIAQVSLCGEQYDYTDAPSFQTRDKPFGTQFSVLSQSPDRGDEDS